MKLFVKHTKVLRITEAGPEILNASMSLSNPGLLLAGLTRKVRQVFGETKVKKGCKEGLQDGRSPLPTRGHSMQRSEPNNGKA